MLEMIFLSTFICSIICAVFIYTTKYKIFYLKASGFCILAVLVVSSLIYGISMYSPAQDTEVWNGQITSKVRDEDYWLETWDCNCVCVATNKDGFCTSEICQTCTQDHYTVDWYANSTVGRINFKSIDWESKRAWSEPDPPAYKNCNVSDPASAEKRFTNYVKMAQDSLFNTDTETDSFAEFIPSYPKVHSFYKINRVISVGSTVSAQELNTLDELLDNSLRTLGALKQVNVIVIATDIKSPEYRHSVENKWLGGKKNDVVVFLGMDGNKFVWTDVMTWALNSGNELFHVTLRDRLTQLQNYDAQKVHDTITETIHALYDRPEMKNFEYLLDDYSPPMWMYLSIMSFSFLIPLIALFIVKRKNRYENRYYR